MTLSNDEYKIVDGGIWIPKPVLEKLRDHYTKCASEASKSNGLKYILTGKADSYIDLLKLFEPLVAG